MPLHPVVRRALLLLGGSYALAWSAIALTAGPGPAAFVQLSGRPQDAGLFFALYSLAAAGGAALGGRLMDRHGRRRVLLAAHLVAAAGYAALGLSFAAGELAPFVASLLVMAAATGATYLTRVAAGDLFPSALRGRGMAWVLWSATAGALLGPALLVGAGPLTTATGVEPTRAVWFVAAPLPLISAALVALAPEPTAIARDLSRYHPADAMRAHAGAAASAAPGPARRLLVAGTVTLAVAQMAMVGVMGVTGVALGHQGHGVLGVAAVMALHFTGMFGASPLVGAFADRVGRRATILVGLAVLAAGGALVATGPPLPLFALALLLVGLGWSFAYVGATVLVTDVTPLDRRARVLGGTDLASSLLAAVGAAAAGWWYAARGLPGLGLAAVALMAIPLVLVLTLPRPHARAPTEGDEDAAS